MNTERKGNKIRQEATIDEGRRLGNKTPLVYDKRLEINQSNRGSHAS